MKCPNPKCDFDGFVASGLCPKCGTKLLPAVKLFHSLVRPKSFFARTVDFWVQIFYRLLESSLMFLVFYVFLFCGVYFYNALCEEITTWGPLPFHSRELKWVKGAAFILIVLLDFRYRWRKR